MNNLNIEHIIYWSKAIMNSEAIRTVGDFLKVIKSLYPEDEVAFFRGQSSNRYAVNSSFCRLVNMHKTDNDTFPYRLANKHFIVKYVCRYNRCFGGI